MRICIVNEFFYPDNTGGTGTVLSDLVRSLREIDTGIEIDVVTSNNLYRQADADLPAYENWNGVNIHRLATPRPNGLPMPLRLASNLLFCGLALVKLVSLRPYDVILLGTAPPMVAMAAQALKQLKGTPFVYIVYDLEPDRSVTMKVLSENHPVAKVFQWGQRRWLNSAAKVIVLGEYMGEYLSQTYRVPPRNIEAISIGSDPNEIIPGSKSSRFRAEHGISGFLVLYSGNFGRYHNFDTILDAARQLRETNPEISFALVGDGAQKGHIDRRVREENLHNVRLYEFVAKDAYADLLASADISLVTLEPGMEGLCVPSKFYSILASGRPVLATVSPKSEVARVIDEAQAGIHLEQAATEHLVSALISLSANPAQADQMGRNARRILEEKYSMSQVARQYHAVLQEAASHVLPSAPSVSLLTRMKHHRSESQFSNAKSSSDK
ncbi:MAG: glycosyltransferase family 4 protein [Janthinobacterium lividum]